MSFRLLSDADVQLLLERRWAPAGVSLPVPPPTSEVTAAIIQLTRGNFRLLAGLVTQMEQVLTINVSSTFQLLSWRPPERIW